MDDPQRTIEHVLPQTPSDVYWKQRFTPEAILIYTHALGNLSLTLDNSSYGNKAFPAKRGDSSTQSPCYATSSLFMERKIAGFEEWTPDAIESRGNEIRDWALSRWHIEDAFGGVPANEEPDEDEESE